MKKKPFNIILSISLILLAGCSAQKNTGLSRAYHNLTAKYNVLFNGTESYKDGLAKIDKEYKDDYSEILPVFNYAAKDIVTLAGPDMDRTIKKCSKLITLHSITAKPKVRDNKTLSADERDFLNKKEYNAFVDDAYLLMGKAHFYKKEYAMAIEIFRKIINDFKDQTAVYEAQVWLARASIETGQFIDALDILALQINNASFPQKLLPELYPTYADYYLKQKDYAKAISFLEKTLEIEKHKKICIRYTYILAQLFEKTGDLKRASDYYGQVIKMNPVYEMAFNAHINRALAYEQGFGQAAQIESELTKMLNDDKNIEFQDQIYYALGNLASKEGHEKKALEYYTKSIETNKNNKQQKVRSYLTIADHFYAIPDYPNSQAYYDSALSNIDPEYPGYNSLFTKSKSLTRLVDEINTVKLGDSVLILAKLPQDELNKRIDQIIQDERKKEELARQKQQEKQLDEQFGQEAVLNNTVKQFPSTTTSTQWYFYNDAAKSMGYREFRLKWGNRRLEDHWQRASKAMVNIMPGTTDEDELKIVDAKGSESTGNKMSRDFYLDNIPKTDSAVEATYKQIEVGLYNMGTIYKDELRDYTKANESFKELVKRFPKSAYLLSSYYNLYSIAKEQNNQPMIDYYKNIITGQFPESTYAKVLTNPEYFRELEKEDQVVQEYYKQTYELYLAGNYAEVINRTGNALKSYPNHALTPKFDYLGILAEAKTTDRKDFRDKLVAVTTRYPGTDIAADAKNLINYMDTEHPELKEEEELKISQQLYQPSVSTPHYFIFALDKKINTNQLVFNIINYNLDHNDSLNLITDVISLNATQNLISVKTFPDQEKVMLYLDAISASDEILRDMPGVTLVPFAISESNLKTLREDKSVDRYLKFFNENYR